MSFLARPLRAMPEAVPGLLAVGVFLAWTASEGGFGIRSTSLGALFLLGLLAVVAAVYRSRLREVPRACFVALSLLAAFTAWSFLSIAWADVNGVAWEGANRTLLYLVVFALFTVTGWRSGSAALVIGAFSFGVAVIGLVSLIETANAAEPRESFIAARWIDPTGYHNASVALFLIAFFPALYLASRWRVPWLGRGLMLGTAVVLIQLALIPQSRGAMIAFPIALALYLVLVPGRVRSLLVIVPVAAAAAVTAGPLIDVYTAVGEGDASAALDDAVQVILLSALVLFAVGGAIGVVDARIELPARATWLVSRAVGVVALAAIVLGAAVFVRELGNPVSWADERWQDFKGGQAERFESVRFGGSLGTNRYDFWTVAMAEFSDAPLTGIGIDNFAVPYLRDRESAEEPLHPHSLPVRVLSQTGLVGALLFVGFIAAALGAAARVRWRRTRGTLGPGLAAVAVVVFTYWVAHGSGDWLWTFPALSAPAFAWLAIAGRIEPTELGGDSAARRTPPPALDAGADDHRAPAPRARRLARSAGALAVAALALAFALASFILPWGAASDVEAAATSWGADPDAAFDRLDRARKLNFLSAEPDLVAGTIAVRLGEQERARASFERAIERNPYSWYARLQLGTLDAHDGRRGAALDHLRAASLLSPDDPLIEVALRRARAGRPVGQARIERDLVDRVCTRIGIASGLDRCR